MQPGDKKTLVDVRSDTLDSEMLTICMAATLNGPFVVNPIDLHAHLQWGTGGANFEADVDIGQGFTLCLPANYVRVDAIYAPVAAPPGNILQVSGSASWGSFAQSGAPARRTIQVGTILNGATAQVNIPNFATSLTLAAAAGVALPPGPCDVQFNLSTIPVRYQFKDWSNDGILSPQAIPIPEISGRFRESWAITSATRKC